MKLEDQVAPLAPMERVEPGLEPLGPVKVPIL